jgi:hypothetical protein
MFGFGSVIPTEAPTPPARSSGFRLGDMMNKLSGGAAVATSLLSLAISVASYVNSTRAPETALVMPPNVRIASPLERDDRHDVILQPTFIIPSGGERPEVITGLNLKVTELATGETVDAAWVQLGRLDLNEAETAVDYVFAADPSPLLLTASSPQLPVTAFKTPFGWRFEEGRYRLTLTAQRSSTETPLEGTVEVEIAAERAERLTEVGGILLRFDAER